MAIYAKDLINAIDKPSADIIGIIIDYGKLKQKLQNPEAQSWYFNQSLESHQAKLMALEEKFEKFRADLNDSGLDELISKLNEIAAEKNSIKGYIGMIKRIYLSSLLSKIKYVEELITIKGRVNKMMPINYYIENTDALLTISGWDAEK